MSQIERCPSEDLINRFVEGALSPEELVSFRGHLAGCPSCRSIVVHAEGSRSEGDAVTLRRAAPLEPSASVGKGTSIGRYLVVDLLGAGGMGKVYAAFDPELDRRIAIKLLRTEATPHDARAALLEEAKVLARLGHPNVVTIHDAGVHEGHVFLAMELVDGGTLRDWWSARPRSWREIAQMMIGAGEGLAAAHGAGFVHRDFKPENVLVGRDGRPRVTDFGLAGRPGLMHGLVVGAPAYMPPEQISGLAFDARADVFSFAVTLWELFYGRRPFLGTRLDELHAAIVARALPDVPLAKRVPAKLHATMVRALSPDPDDRPSLDVLLAALRTDPARTRRRVLAYSGLAALAVLGGVGANDLAASRRASCTAIAELDGTWDDTRRSELKAAFAKIEVPFASSAFDAVARGLDDYARSWSSMSKESCEATRVARTQPEEMMALRASCLADRRRELAGAVAVLARADRETVEQAGRVVAGLEAVSRCAAVEALAAREPRPKDPEIAQRLDAALARIGEADALMRAGKTNDALAVATSAVDELRIIGHAPSRAHGAFTLAVLNQHLGRLDVALGLAREALLSAWRGHDELEVENALLALTTREGMAGSAELGLFYADLAEATIDRAKLPDSERVDVAARRFQILFASGRTDEALTLGQKVVDEWGERLGPENLNTLQVRSDLGIVYFQQGRFDEARASFADALAGLEALAGRGTPETLPAKNNLGSVLILLGRVDEGAALLEAALEEGRAAFGEQSLYTAMLYVSLGQLRIAQGRFEEAITFERRAIERLEALGLDVAALWEPLTELGTALVRAGRPAEALPVLERAEKITIDRPLANTDVARVHVALAEALVRAKREPDRARVLATQAEEIWRDAARRWGGHNAARADAARRVIGL